MFGHEIQLNFKGEDLHKSPVGGFFSMLLFVMFFIYFVLCVKTLIYGEDNQKFSGLGTLDLEELGPVSYSDTSLVFFAIIRNDKPGAKTPFIDGSSNFSQYVNVYWTQVIANYYIPKNEGLNRFIYRNISAKNCTQDDFGYDPSSVKIFNSWAGYSMICPDFPEDMPSFTLEGDTESMIT